MKGDELNYQIQAIQLNKIDEVSVEHSSEPSSSKQSASVRLSQESSIGNIDVKQNKHSGPERITDNITPITYPDSQ